jgi:hypothetical protein
MNLFLFFAKTYVGTIRNDQLGYNMECNTIIQNNSFRAGGETGGATSPETGQMMPPKGMTWTSTGYHPERKL